MNSSSIDEIHKYLVDFDISGLPKTSHVKIGDYVYPITVFKNGVVIIDYPFGYFNGLYENNKGDVTGKS